MRKEDLLKFCRYYHGEEKPSNLSHEEALFWDFEYIWVLRTLEGKSLTLRKKRMNTQVLKTLKRMMEFR